MLPDHSPGIRASSLRLLVLLVTVAIVPSARGQSNATSTGPPSASEWRADLRYLAATMPRVHPNLFKWTSKAAFDSAVSELDRRIPSLDRDAILVGLMRIVALPGDGHTSMLPFMLPALGLHRGPLRLYRFDDGFFVKAADPRYAAIVGSRVIRVGHLSVDSAFDRVAPLVPPENAMWRLTLGPDLLVVPEILHGLGISDERDAVSLELERDGARSTIRLPAGTLSAAWMTHDPGRPPVDAGWVEPRSASAAPLPVSRRSLPRMLGIDWLADSRVLYAQYNAVADAPDMSVAQFAARLGRLIDSLPVEKFVLDVRANAGGNGFLNRPLLRTLINSRIDRRGHFFVLIGRQTFSAAQVLVDDLEAFTEAIFVGEPTGSRVNFFGDHQVVTLPNSKLPVMVSTLWWQRVDPRDRREWKAPDLAATLSSVQFAAGVDPAVDLVLTWNITRTVGGRVRAALASRDGGRILDAIRDASSDPVNRWGRVESQVNSLGYELLGGGQVDDAVLVLEANTKAFAASANAFDSLGEALAARGDTAAAITAYERALAIDPSLVSSRRAVARLKGGASSGTR